MFMGWDTNFWMWVLLVFTADITAGALILYAEYRWFKPPDTKSMAKQVKKLLAEQLSKREAKKAMRKIDEAVANATEEESK